MLAPGTRLGRFQLAALLGRGGMGEVWQAHDTKLGRDVAIKLLREEMAQDREWLARFHREARALAALSHPNVAQIYELPEAVPVPADASSPRASKPVPFLVMELVPGQSLRDRLQQGPLPLPEALQVALQAAQALAAAHARGLVHRDIKPANIFLTPQGQVKLLDFGLARWQRPEESGEEEVTLLQSTPGVVAGTPSYMAPEQVLGQECTDRCDVWGLACCLAEMLTGRRVFEAPTLPATLQLILTSDSGLVTTPAVVPRALAQLLRQCLQRDPSKRPSMAHVAAQLAALQARLTPAGQRLRRWQRAAVAVSVLALALAGLAASKLWPRPKPASLGKLSLRVEERPRESGGISLAEHAAFRHILAETLSQRPPLELMSGGKASLSVSWSAQPVGSEVQLAAWAVDRRSEEVVASLQTRAAAPAWREQAQALAVQLADRLEVEGMARELASEDELHGVLLRRTASPAAARAFARGLRSYAGTRLADARESFAAAAQLDESFWPAYLYLALVSGSTSHFEQARAFLHKARRLCPSPSREEAALLDMAEAMTSDDRLRMVAAVEETRQLFPNSGELTYRAAWAYRSIQQPERAVPLLEELIAKNWRPDWSPTWAQLANTYLLAGRLEEAVQRARACEARFPKEARCSFTLALALRLAGEERQAREALREAVRKREDYYPGDPLGSGQLLIWWASLAGSPEETRRQWELLLEQAQRAREEEKENLEAHRLYGEALLHLGRPQEAKEVLQALLPYQDRNPYAAYVLMALARTHAALGAADEARRLLRQAEKLWRQWRPPGPGPGPMAYNLAAAWAALGELHEARIWLDRAKELRAFSWLEGALDPDLAPLREAGLLPEAQPPGPALTPPTR